MEDYVKPILTTYELQKLHIMNNGSSGYVEKHSMRWVTRCTIPRMQCPQVKKVEEVKYTILNMFSVENH